MADISRYKMSQERLDDLKKELEYCETVREKEKVIEVKTIVDRSGIKAIASSLRDIKEIQMIRSELDTREQEARIAKLNRDAERGGSESDSPCGVVLLPAVLTAPVPPCEEDADG